MSYMPMTPFRRRMDAGLFEQARAIEDPPAGPDVDKWEVLRALTDARSAYGLSHRELSVLQALLSFHPETLLRSSSPGLVVFPSNASICRRLNGMACSTMRRHLAKLVEVGLIARRDSANGKRFARRSRDGVQAFGFDLSPLRSRYGQIMARAEEMRAETETLRCLKQDIGLMRRDLAALVELGQAEVPNLPLWDQIDDLQRLTARHMRRKLDRNALEEISVNLGAALIRVKHLLCEATAEVSTSNAQNEQHQHSSNKDDLDNEDGPQEMDGPSYEPERGKQRKDRNAKPPEIPLTLVMATCPEALTYATEPLRGWREFIALGKALSSMMGIPRRTWEDACQAMGSEQAAIVVAALLERFSDIQRPGAYLNSLTCKARDGRFTCLPMISALQRRAA